MALKCSVCGKFLARGTAHDHDRDRRPDPRHYNPHPPAGTTGESLEDENPISYRPPAERVSAAVHTLARLASAAHMSLSTT